MQILTPDWWQWIDAHHGEDINKLRLRHHGDEAAMFAILQLECRTKAAKKLPDFIKTKEMLFPTLLSVEQCTSESLSKVHARIAGKPQSVLDMTCGLGIDAMSLARVAHNVVAIERNKDIVRAVAHNVKTQGIDNMQVICSDSVEWLRANALERYDCIFIDPARRDAVGNRCYALSDCMPNILEILPLLESRARRIIVKASPMLDVDMTSRQLPDCSDIYAIGTGTECKEIVVVIDVERKVPAVSLHAVVDGIEVMSFTKEEEKSAICQYSMPQAEGVLYEPYAAVMKLAPYKLLAGGDLSALNRDTHLYWSAVQEPFPGIAYDIEHIEPFDKSGIRYISKTYPKINVTVRNFIMKAPQLAARLKVKEGGEKQLFGVKCIDDKYYMIVGTRRPSTFGKHEP